MHSRPHIETLCVHYIRRIRVVTLKILTMSTSSSANELASTPPQPGAKRNGRPQSADAKMKNKPVKTPKSSKGLMKIFKNKKTKENGVIPVKPSCFDDDFVRRPESPDSPNRGGPVVTSSKSKGKEERGYGLWRSKVRPGGGGCYCMWVASLSPHSTLLMRECTTRRCSQQWSTVCN